MIRFDIDPPLSSKPGKGAFVQKITMMDDDQQLGRACWHAAEESDGIAQILELWIDPKVHRSGHGRRLLHALVDQFRELHRRRGQSPRRLWIGVGHKSQIIGRSFLSSEGFHHIGSAPGVRSDEDVLIYVKSLD
jgi:GNAT superfamily N-acetyltransferase